MLVGIIVPPQLFNVCNRHSQSTVVRLAQNVHLLLFLVSSFGIRRFQESDIVRPKPARILVHPDVLKDKFKGFTDGCAVGGVAFVAVASSDIGKVAVPEAHVGHGTETAGKD